MDLCPSCLDDCAASHISIECYLKPPDFGIPANFRFIAHDCQEELDRKSQRPFFKMQESGVSRSSSERESRVFVWGLNDKEQLAGLVGSKVPSRFFLFVVVCLPAILHARAVHLSELVLCNDESYFY